MELEKVTYKLALKVNSNDVTVHSNYGLLLANTGRNDEVEEHYKFLMEKASSVESE